MCVAGLLLTASILFSGLDPEDEAELKDIESRIRLIFSGPTLCIDSDNNILDVGIDDGVGDHKITKLEINGIDSDALKVFDESSFLGKLKLHWIAREKSDIEMS